MADLDILLREYAQFEDRLRKVMSGICAPHCRACSRVCCREELCRETIESPFLSLLRQKFPPPSAYCSQNGWLTRSGCALSIGRAPVCYHFLCTDILDARRTPIDCYMLEVLADLVNHLGKNALAGRHLVAIMNPDDLYRLKFKRFKKRLTLVRNVYHIIVDYFDHAQLDAGHIFTLSQIRPLPSDINASNMMAPVST
ncbi:MAG: hypothetical protein JRF72_00595 [Deltaproteobacteria bacterium]|jgi:hypothetical protein|nr:hypothetical protein [Deltaproteobacteria bacterium]